MKWHVVVDALKPYIVKIETPSGHGTGFLFFYNEDKSLCGIATAHHVISDIDEWQQPMRIRHHASGKVDLFKQDERFIFGDADSDSAVILIPSGIFDFPAEPIPLLESGKVLKIGVEVGWLGFPALEPRTPCFFCGNISARQKESHSYLIDGVAINGVSGGPVFDADDKNKPRIIGSISAYIANRARGDSLPGLAVARDVSHFHDIAKHIKSIDEANRKKQELEKQIPPPDSPELEEAPEGIGVPPEVTG